MANLTIYSIDFLSNLFVKANPSDPLLLMTLIETPLSSPVSLFFNEFSSTSILMYLFLLKKISAHLKFELFRCAKFNPKFAKAKISTLSS